jgi:hypothetical protein
MSFRPDNHTDKYRPWSQRSGNDEVVTQEDIDAERRYQYVSTRRATDKQIAYAKSLIVRASKHESISKSVEDAERLMGNGETIFNVQSVIESLNYWLDKLKAETTASETASVEKPATNQNLATPKQLGFIKSLLNKKVVSDEANALREANPELTSKTASDLIGLLIASPDKETN